jgi:serine-threonine kinase receptor-associated protein
MLRKGETGDWIGTFVGHKGAVWSAHLNSKATQALTGSADYTARVWDAMTGEEVRSFNHSKIVKCVNFGPDDTKIVTGAQDKLLRIFDLAQPDAEPQKLEGHTQPMKTVQWLNDTTVVSGVGDNTVKVWDTRTLKETLSLPFKVPVTSVEICLDKKHLCVAASKEVTFFELSSFQPVKTLTLGVEVASASLSPDGTTIVTGGPDFWAHVWDFATGKELELLKGHHGPIHCIRFAPDGQTFASSSEDGTIRLWQSGEPRTYGLWQETKSAAPQTSTPSQ